MKAIGLSDVFKPRILFCSRNILLVFWRLGSVYWDVPNIVIARSAVVIKIKDNLPSCVIFVTSGIVLRNSGFLASKRLGGRLR